MNEIVIDINNYKDYIDEDLLIGKKIIGDTSNKYYLYLEKDIPINIIIKSPPIRLIYDYNNQIYNTINIPLYPEYDKMKTFCNLVSTLEKKVKSLLGKLDDKIKWIPTIKKINHIKNIKTNLSIREKKNFKIISDKNIKSIKDMKSTGSVELVMHFSHVWVTDTKAGIYNDICQIKYSSPDSIIDKVYFNVDDNKTKKSINREFNKDTTNTISKEEINKRIPKVSPFIPTNNELLSGLKKLKKS